MMFKDGFLKDSHHSYPTPAANSPQRHLLPRRTDGRTCWRNRDRVWACGRAAHASPDHGRADEVSDAGGLDGHRGNGIVRANLQKLWAGDCSLSGAGSHRNRRAVREWTGIFTARVAGGKAASGTSIGKSRPCRLACRSLRHGHTGNSRDANHFLRRRQRT
jgi:hypothetical protein